MKINKKPISIEDAQIRMVRNLPKRAVTGEIIFNKADGFYYIGIRTKEDKNGSNMEKASI